MSLAEQVQIWIIFEASSWEYWICSLFICLIEWLSKARWLKLYICTHANDRTTCFACGPIKINTKTRNRQTTTAASSRWHGTTISVSGKSWWTLKSFQNNSGDLMCSGQKPNQWNHSFRVTGISIGLGRGSYEWKLNTCAPSRHVLNSLNIRKTGRHSQAIINGQIRKNVSNLHWKN